MKVKNCIANELLLLVLFTRPQFGVNFLEINVCFNNTEIVCPRQDIYESLDLARTWDLFLARCTLSIGHYIGSRQGCFHYWFL